LPHSIPEEGQDEQAFGANEEAKVAQVGSGANAGEIDLRKKREAPNVEEMK